jgi:hypothetical protein
MIKIENKLKFDIEYPCTWAKENQYLTEHGIRYTFVKEINGITTWKYTKNFKLFDVLKDFYSDVYSK